LGKLTTASCGDAQHLAENALGGVHGLQGLRNDGPIERMVFETEQPRFDIHLDHVDAVANTGENAFRVDFDAIAGHIAGLVEITQQPAVATTEVENVLAGLQPVGDHREVEALALLGLDSPLVLGHTAMFPR
jgi:hypothetical protein